MINVRNFGAKGDGTTNDTAAILSTCEAALGLAAGSFDQGGDPYPGGYPTTSRPAVFFPAGTYRVTRPIRVRYMNLCLMGEPGPTGAWKISRTATVSKILVDHTGDAFALD